MTIQESGEDSYLFALKNKFKSPAKIDLIYIPFYDKFKQLNAKELQQEIFYKWDNGNQRNSTIWFSKNRSSMNFHV